MTFYFIVSETTSYIAKSMHIVDNNRVYIHDAIKVKQLPTTNEAELLYKVIKPETIVGVLYRKIVKVETNIVEIINKTQLEKPTKTLTSKLHFSDKDADRLRELLIKQQKQYFIAFDPYTESPYMWPCSTWENKSDSLQKDLAFMAPYFIKQEEARSVGEEAHKKLDLTSHLSSKATNLMITDEDISKICKDAVPNDTTTIGNAIMEKQIQLSALISAKKNDQVRSEIKRLRETIERLRSWIPPSSKSSSRTKSIKKI